MNNLFRKVSYGIFLQKRCASGLLYARLPLSKSVFTRDTVKLSNSYMSTKSEGNSENEVSGDSKANSTDGTNENQAPDSPELQLKKKDEEIKELKEKILRSLAEEENVRRIAKRDVDNAKQYALSSFAKSMLDVADNLERALASVSEDKRKSNDDVRLLFEGVDMTQRGLLKVFHQYGIEKVCMLL